MTPEQHAQRIRQIAFMLEKADYGMGMPRDYERVLGTAHHARRRDQGLPMGLPQHR
jgi:hypothetical protein